MNKPAQVIVQLLDCGSLFKKFEVNNKNNIEIILSKEISTLNVQLSALVKKK